MVHTSKGNLATNTLRVCDIVADSEMGETPLHSNGLPGIYQSAKIRTGDISIMISLSRAPFSREFEQIARHFNSFAEAEGYPYEIEPIDARTFILKKALSTGDHIESYSVTSRNTGTTNVVDIIRGWGSEPNLLPAYLQKLQG